MSLYYKQYGNFLKTSDQKAMNWLTWANVGGIFASIAVFFILMRFLPWVPFFIWLPVAIAVGITASWPVRGQLLVYWWIQRVRFMINTALNADKLARNSAEYYTVVNAEAPAFFVEGLLTYGGDDGQSTS